MAQIECEQMLSCKEPGGLFAICSQGISHCGEIPVRARVLPRETQRKGTLLGSFHLETIKATLLAGFHLYFAEIFLPAQKSFREVISPQIFPFGKSSQKSYDSLSHLG